MQKIHQMQLRFVPAEDRLMLRVRTADQREFRLWFFIICELLVDAVRKADWDLTPQIAKHVEPVSTTAH